jgi:hypothetical protein
MMLLFHHVESASDTKMMSESFYHGSRPCEHDRAMKDLDLRRETQECAMMIACGRAGEPDDDDEI